MQTLSKGERSLCFYWRDPGTCENIAMGITNLTEKLKSLLVDLFSLSLDSESLWSWKFYPDTVLKLGAWGYDETQGPMVLLALSVLNCGVVLRRDQGHHWVEEDAGWCAGQRDSQVCSAGDPQQVAAREEDQASLREQQEEGIIQLFTSCSCSRVHFS